MAGDDGTAGRQQRRCDVGRGQAGPPDGIAHGRGPVPAPMLTGPGGSLEDLLYGKAAAEPVPVAALRAAATRARADFQTARYDWLSASLPALIATATITRDHDDGDDRATASALLDDAYIVTANLRIKLNDDLLTCTAAPAGPAKARDLLISAARRHPLPGPSPGSALSPSASAYQRRPRQ